MFDWDLILFLGLGYPWCSIQWGWTCNCYTPLHFLFRKDRKIDRATSSRDVEIV